MIVKKLGDVERVTIRNGMHRKILIGESEGASNFIMRLFEVEKDTEAKCHVHSWEHEIFILEGDGTVINPEGQEIDVEQGSVLYIPAGEKHAITNKGSNPLKFICVIPKVVDESKVTVVACQ